MDQGNRPGGFGEERCYADEDDQPSSQEVAQHSYSFYPASTYLTGESSGFNGLNSIEEIDGTTIPDDIPLQFPADIATFNAYLMRSTRLQRLLPHFLLDPYLYGM